MFIAKFNDIIIQAENSQEELLEKLQKQCKVYTSIEETNIDYTFYKGKYLTPEEINIKEIERKAQLFLTKADVERAIYNSKGMNFDDVLELVNDLPQINLKVLKIELNANHFYRGNPFVSKIGEILGFTEQELDDLFEYGDFRD